ncbi:hypothetical protein BXZ70DRAFT_1006653 [Cristinia sonorae]|uniref:Uncharacterized protein n=1 Tax=Cristinia sonorae TaxID=1940300 RepID=A0A8K0XQZ0_9AGAR|nr:hypothetical protein BXZ70DRAFT_1006653 [Cristinia sonorae]
MSVFDKLHDLKDALQGSSDDHDKAPVPAGERKGQDQVRDEIYKEEKREEGIQKKEGWSERLKDVLDGGEAREARHKREAEEEQLRIEKEKEEARVKVETERGWGGKLHDALDGGKHRKELEEAEFQRLEQAAQEEKKKHDSLGEKLRDALDDSTDELTRKVKDISGSSGARVRKAEEHEQADQEHLTDKIRQLWRDAPDEERKEQKEHVKVRERDGKEPAGGKGGDAGWRDQLHALAGGSHKEEKKQVERSWLKEKLNNMAGGGAAGEKNEDKLDKTIDFIQEHILKQGDQSNESALENMKDEQISDAIRLAYSQVFGRDLPIHDK